MKRFIVAIIEAFLFSVMFCPLSFGQGGIRVEEGSRRIKLTVWSNTNQYGEAKVYMGGRYMGKITSFYRSTPNVGASGCVTFEYTLQLSGGIRPAVIRIESDYGYIWHREADIQMDGKYAGTLRVYCRGEKDKKATRSTDSGGSAYSSSYGSSGYSGGSGSYSSSDYSRNTDDALAAAGAAAVVAAGALVFVGAANSDWDAYTTRVDIDPIWGQKLGTWGVSLSWRDRSLLGFTAGIGKDTKDHYTYSYGEYGVETKKTTNMRWMAGVQLWVVNGINIELGVGSMYHHKLSDVKTSAYIMSNAEVHLFNGVGLYTGLGIGKSLSGSAPVKFLWNVGLRLRVFAN